MGADPETEPAETEPVDSLPADDPHELLRSDPDLGPLVERHGELLLDPADDLYRRLVVSILRQQVSMASAAATRERLFSAVEVTPEGVLAADPDRLREAGLSGQKTRYVREVARAFQEEEYDLAYFEGMENDDVVAELTGITGVGPWTARMQLMFSLGRPDVFPVGDLGIRRGMEVVCGIDREDRAAQVEYAERWRPVRSYASLYLWRATENGD